MGQKTEGRDALAEVALLVITKLQRHLLLLFSTLLLVISTALPTAAMAPTLMQIAGASGSSSSNQLGWVELDGRNAFQIAAPGTAINQRRGHIGDNFEAIRDRYLQLDTPVVDITSRQSKDDQPEVYVNGQYLMTVTQADANLQGMSPAGVVRQLEQSVP